MPRSSASTASGQFALIAAREAWADAGSPEVDPERLGVVIASGIGGVTTLLAPVRHAARRRAPRRVLPADRADADAQRPGRARRARARRPGRRAHPGQRLRPGAEAIALRRRHDPHRPRRRRRRRRHRGGHPPAAARRLRRDAGAVDPQRRARARLAALRQGPRRLRARRGRRRPRAGDAPSTRRPAAPRIYARARRRRHHRPTPTTSPQPDPVGRRRGPRHGRWPLRDGRRSTPPTSCTSTRTPPRRRSATSPRSRRSARRSATPPTASCVSATKSMTGHLLGAAGALETIATILALHDRMAPADDQPRRPRRRGRPRRRPRRAARRCPTATSRP